MPILVFESKMLSLLNTEGYIYIHENRNNGKSVGIVPFKLDQEKRSYLARVEICPAHSPNPNTYCITGGVNLGEQENLAAARELLEESGYKVTSAEMIHLGNVRPSKQADTLVSLFTVDLTNKIQGEIVGDGTKWEQGASALWLSYSEGLQVIDPLFVAGMCRTQELLSGNQS